MLGMLFFARRQIKSGRPFFFCIVILLDVVLHFFSFCSMEFLWSIQFSAYSGLALTHFGVSLFFFCFLYNKNNRRTKNTGGKCKLCIWFSREREKEREYQYLLLSFHFEAWLCLFYFLHTHHMGAMDEMHSVTQLTMPHINSVMITSIDIDPIAHISLTFILNYNQNS